MEISDDKKADFAKIASKLNTLALSGQRDSVEFRTLTAVVDIADFLEGQFKEGEKIEISTNMYISAIDAVLRDTSLDLQSIGEVLVVLSIYWKYGDQIIQCLDPVAYSLFAVTISQLLVDLQESAKVTDKPEKNIA